MMDAMFDELPSAPIVGKSMQFENDVLLYLGPSHDLLATRDAPSSPDIRSPIPGDKANFDHLMWHPQRRSHGGTSSSSSSGGANSSHPPTDVQGDITAPIKATVPRKPLDRAALESVRKTAMETIPHARAPPRQPAQSWKDTQDARTLAASAWLAAEKRKVRVRVMVRVRGVHRPQGRDPA